MIIIFCIPNILFYNLLINTCVILIGYFLFYHKQSITYSLFPNLRWSDVSILKNLRSHPLSNYYYFLNCNCCNNEYTSRKLKRIYYFLKLYSVFFVYLLLYCLFKELDKNNYFNLIYFLT